MKRPLDDGYAATPNIQVEAINQAIAQHQNVIQMQSDAAQVLGTVSGLVAALGGGYPAEQLQAVASQVHTLRAIQENSTQALHTSCTTLQNLLSHASTQASQPLPLPWAGAPMQQLPLGVASAPQQMQPQMFAPPQQQMQMQPPPQQQQQMQPQQQIPYGTAPLMPQLPPMQQQLYGDIDPFGPGAMASPPLPFVDPVRTAGEKRKTSLCNNFQSGQRTCMVEWFTVKLDRSRPCGHPLLQKLACLHRATRWAR